MKKMMKVLLASVLLVAMTAVSVCADGSPVKPGVIKGDWIAYDENGNEYDHDVYELVFDELSIEDIERHPEDIREMMAAVNAGEKAMMDYLKGKGVSLPANTSSIGVYTEIRDLIVRRKDTKERVQAYNVTCTIEVPSLVEGNGEVYIYHHSTLRGVDELIKPTSVDFGEKAVTATYRDLSPVSFIYIKTTQKPVDTSAKDYTSLFGLIALCAGAALIATNKKEKTAA